MVEVSSVCSSLPSLLQAICVGTENLQVMYPAIFEQLLLFVEFSCKPPQYGRMETKHVANAKYNQVGNEKRTPKYLVFIAVYLLLQFVSLRLLDDAHCYSPTSLQPFSIRSYLFFDAREVPLPLPLPSCPYEASVTALREIDRLFSTPIRSPKPFLPQIPSLMIHLAGRLPEKCFSPAQFIVI